MVDIKNLVKNKNIARFASFTDNTFYYLVRDVTTGNLYQFEIPLEDFT